MSYMLKLVKESGKKDLPITDIDGTIIIGPDIEAIEKALEI